MRKEIDFHGSELKEERRNRGEKKGEMIRDGCNKIQYLYVKLHGSPWFGFLVKEEHKLIDDNHWGIFVI